MPNPIFSWLKTGARDEEFPPLVDAPVEAASPPPPEPAQPRGSLRQIQVALGQPIAQGRNAGLRHDGHGQGLATCIIHILLALTGFGHRWRTQHTQQIPGRACRTFHPVVVVEQAVAVLLHADAKGQVGKGLHQLTTCLIGGDALAVIFFAQLGAIHQRRVFQHRQVVGDRVERLLGRVGQRDRLHRRSLSGRNGQVPAGRSSPEDEERPAEGGDLGRQVVEVRDRELGAVEAVEALPVAGQHRRIGLAPDDRAGVARV